MDRYAELKAEIKSLLSDAIFAEESNLSEKFRSFDSELLQILRDIGKDTMMDVGSKLVAVEEEKQKSSGLTPQERKQTPFLPSSVPSK